MSGRGPLRILVAGVALGVIAQAILAGLFLSGVGEARLVHTIVGWLLPYYALIVAVVAALTRPRHGWSRGAALGVYLLPVVLWSQEVLGHLPFPWATAVHVPLGVLLFAGALLLAVFAKPSGGAKEQPRHPAAARRS